MKTNAGIDPPSIEGIHRMFKSRIFAATAFLLSATTMSSAQGFAITGEATCGTIAITECMRVAPSTAKEHLELEIAAGDAATAWQRMGDLLSMPGKLNDPKGALAAYANAYKAGNLWGGVALAKALSTAEGSTADQDRAVAILTDVSNRSADVRKWASKALGDALVRRSGPGDRQAALAAYVEGVTLGNHWATLPLVAELVSGSPIPIDTNALARLVEEASLSDPTFSQMGTKALANIRFAQGDEAGAVAVLRKLAEGEGPAADQARVDLGKRLIISPATFKEGMYFLNVASKGGSATATLALADHYASLRGGQAALDRAISAYDKAVIQDSALVPVVENKIGDALVASGRPQDLKLSIRHYENAAKAGNAWGWFRLAKAYRTGAGVRVSPEKSREYARKAMGEGNVVAGIAGLFSLEGTPSALGGEGLVEAVRQGLGGATPRQIADAIGWTKPMARVTFMQQVWKEAGVYKGPVDGIAGPLTKSAMSEFCGSKTCGDVTSLETLVSTIEALPGLQVRTEAGLGSIRTF